MTILCIDQKNMQLTHRSDYLQIRQSGQLRQTVPLKLLQSVVILNKCELSSTTLNKLAQHQIGVICLNHHKAEDSCVLYPQQSANKLIN